MPTSMVLLLSSQRSRSVSTEKPLSLSAGEVSELAGDGSLSLLAGRADPTFPAARFSKLVQIQATTTITILRWLLIMVAGRSVERPPEFQVFLQHQRQKRIKCQSRLRV